MDTNAQDVEAQIKARIEELPADIQNAILSADFNQKIQSIGAEQKLHIDQIAELGNLTMLVMLGFMNEGEYKNELKGLVQNAEIAEKIASNINTQVFLPIRESMKAFAAKQNTPTVAESPAPVTPVTVPPSTPIATPPVPQPEVGLPVVQKVDMHPADVMLTEKTVATMPTVTTPAAPTAVPKVAETKSEPPKPTDYKADPYREPIS